MQRYDTTLQHFHFIMVVDPRRLEVDGLAPASTCILSYSLEKSESCYIPTRSISAQPIQKKVTFLKHVLLRVEMYLITS